MIFLNNNLRGINYSTTGSVDPKTCATDFAKIMKGKGHVLDFSLESLEVEVDHILAQYATVDFEDLSILEDFLTAYVGETLIANFGGSWTGNYYAPMSLAGVNYYSSFITINDFRFNPNHFIGYYLTNGKKTEGTFYEYLYKRNQITEDTHDYSGDGLVGKIKKH